MKVTMRMMERKKKRTKKRNESLWRGQRITREGLGEEVWVETTADWHMAGDRPKEDM